MLKIARVGMPRARRGGIFNISEKIKERGALLERTSVSGSFLLRALAPLVVLGGVNFEVPLGGGLPRGNVGHINGRVLVGYHSGTGVEIGHSLFVAR